MYIDLGDLICRFGKKEVSKRADDGRGLIVDYENPDFSIQEIADRIQCAIDDSYALIKMHLSCCFDMKKIDALVLSGDEFGILKYWQSHLARYFLHEDIALKNCKHIVAVNYSDVIKQMKETCSCGLLVSDSGTACYRVSKCKISVAKRNTCFKNPCEKNCSCNSCCGENFD